MSKLLGHLEDVGPGWSGILRRLHAGLIEAGAGDYEVTQVKEKFGGLRVYLTWTAVPGLDMDRSGVSARDLISKAEAEAYRTCEFCGSTDATTTSMNGRARGWIKTLCDDCRVPPALRGDSDA